MVLCGRAQITQITRIIWKDEFGWSLTDHTDFQKSREIMDTNNEKYASALGNLIQ